MLEQNDYEIKEGDCAFHNPPRFLPQTACPEGKMGVGREEEEEEGGRKRNVKRES